MQDLRVHYQKIFQGLACAAWVLSLTTSCARQAEPATATTSAAPTQQSVPTAPAAVATRDPRHAVAKMQECRARLEAAVSQQLVSNASVDNGRPILWVGPAWKASPQAVQEQLVRDTACFFVSGDETRTIRFSLYDTATDQELSVWNHTHLVRP